MLNQFKLARLLSHGFLGSLALIAAGPAWADAIQWDNAIGPAWNNAYWVSPYKVTDQSNGQDILIYCLDFNHDIAPPNNWVANLNLLSPSNLSHFQYGGSYLNPPIPAPTDPYNRYLEAAWLFTNMIDSGADQQNAIASQVAAWLLFVDQSHIGSYTVPGQGLEGQIAATTGSYSFTDYVGGQGVSGQLTTFTDAVNQALTASQNAVLQGGWTAADNWAVVTADPSWVNGSNGGTPVQEFLTPVPEPSSIRYMGTLLLAAGLIFRKNRTAMLKFRR